jgi:hypothetical protein
LKKWRSLRDAGSTPARPTSVVAWRRLEDDSLQLSERLAAETKRGLEPLESELAGVQRPPQLIECGALAVEYRVARSVQQDQVSRAAEAMREAHVPFALAGVETLEGQNDALTSL